MKRSREEYVAAFWAKVNKTATCWLWTAATWGNGYGCARMGGNSQNAHRVSWELANGPIPSGSVLLHSCDVPACVNPAHLSVGTQAENMRDAAIRGRISNQHKGKTHCKRGHEFTLENTRLDGRGRQCRQCDSIRWQSWVARNPGYRTERRPAP